MSNPVMILEQQKRMNYRTQIFGNAAFTFHLAKDLDLKTQIGVDNHNNTYRGYSSIGLNNISMYLMDGQKSIIPIHCIGRKKLT